MTASFWIVAAALTLIAVGLLVWPVWREHRGNGRRAFAALWPVLAIAPVAVGLYLTVSTHESYDAAGWRQLGDNYRQQGDFGRKLLDIDYDNRCADNDNEIHTGRKMMPILTL